MDRNVTVGVRGLLVTGLVLLALAAAYLLGGGAGGSATVAQAATTSAPAPRAAAARILTMTGSGEATAVPDQLSFSVAVSLTRADLRTALDQANATMGRVLASQGEFGVRRGDTRTSGLSMSPVYDYSSTGPATLVGYHVSEQADVLVKDLAQGGDAMSAAVDAGGNAVRVNDIRLKVGDPDAVLAKARQAAVAVATTKAEEYAAATGQELGAVVTLKEVGGDQDAASYQSQSLGGAAYDSVDGVSAVPIRGGHDQLSVDVEVVWEFAATTR